MTGRPKFDQLLEDYKSAKEISGRYDDKRIDEAPFFGVYGAVAFLENSIFNVIREELEQGRYNFDPGTGELTFRIGDD